MTVYEKREEPLDDLGPPDIQRYRCDKVQFNTASPVLLPSSVLVLQAVLDYQLEHPDRKILITAHTDTVASAASNQTLSDNRAKSLLYVLEKDRDAWAKLAEAEHRPGDVDAFLKEVARKNRDWNCHPERDPHPIAAFKTAYNKRSSKYTDTSNQADVLFWERVFNSYQYRLSKYMGFKRKTEAIEALRWVDPEHKAIGCGERHLHVVTKDNVDEVENRRIEFLFFEPGDEPTPDDGTPGEVEGHPAYLEDVHDPKHFHLVDMDCPDIIFEGKRIPPGNLLFVIDFSGSMNGIRLKRALDELVDAVSMLDERYHLAIVFFGTHIETVWWSGESATRTDRDGTERTVAAFYVEGADPRVKFRVASPENIEDALNRLDRIPLLGGTRTYEAFETALGAVGLRDIDTDQGDRNTLEFLSDGNPNGLFVLANGKTRLQDGRPITSKYTAEPSTRRNEAQERAEISELIPKNNANGFVINVTGYFPEWETSKKARRYDPSTFQTWLESLTTTSDPDGEFVDRRYGWARK